MTVASAVAEERARAGRAPASSSPRTLAFAGLLVAAVFLSCGEEVTTPLPQVTVTAVTPSEGPLTGGTVITIQGTNFIDVTKVTVGGTSLHELPSTSATQITGFTGPVPDAGTVDVVVASRTRGTGTCEGCFSYYDPTMTVDAVSPDTGDVGNSVAVTISGTGFVEVTSVTVGGRELEERTVVSSNEITGTVPAHDTPGILDVVVTSGRTTPGICQGCFRYLLDVMAQPLATGYQHTCALSVSGAAYCWGDNGTGQLGDGSNTNSSTPVAVAGNLEFRAVFTGEYHTCGLTPDGRAYCWGSNAAGELGDGLVGWDNSTTAPVQVVGGLTFSSLALGTDGYFTCGLARSGRAYCWGQNNNGQLGSPTELFVGTPTPVTSSVPFRAITAGDHHTCALAVDGTAYCWGRNSAGQLGDGTTVDRTLVAPVAGDHHFELITGGEAHTCALTDAGTVDCWGFLYSRLGSVPVALFEQEAFSVLDAGGYHACGIGTNGTTYCWGQNDSGQLGDGTTNWNDVPVEVSGDLAFSRVSAGRYHTCGLTTTGALYCWGRNGGRLGNGTLDNSAVPVPVLPFGASPPR